MVKFLLGLQSGHTKHPYFLCLWNSRIKREHWVRENRPPCKQMTVGETNVLYEPLVPRNKIIFPSLHIKLEPMKQFVKAIDKEGTCFEYICKAFPGVTIEKLKKRYIRRSRYQKTYKDQNFITSMNELESKAWRSFVAVTKNFLGKKRSHDYVLLVQNMLDNYHDIGANMSIKVHFLDSHLDRFPENCGDVSDEQGE